MNWHELSNKSEISGLYMKKKTQIYGESPQVFDPHISEIDRFVVDGATKLVFVSYVVEADDSPVPTLWSFLLSPPLPTLLILGNSISNPCWTDGGWFSSISPCTMFTKSINGFTISFGAFSLLMIPSHHLQKTKNKSYSVSSFVS